jgi:serine/threonine protein kinase
MVTSTARESVITPEIGKYHLIAELARGGMGNVYLAAAQGLGGFRKLHVVKELKPELCDDETYVGMFLDEARLVARLIHPNIVQTNEVGSDGSRHYMVMEFLDGRSLHRIGKRLGSGFPVSGHVRVISEALLGLHFAHEMREFDGEPLGIVHRDVSPLNVFVTFAGQAKVLDFGIAKALNSSHYTKVGVLKGRVAYMAPEQATGANVDRRADIYSAGVMLWEAAAGRRLWPGMSEVEILTRILRDGPPPLRSVCPDAPKDLERICARAMAFDREERYATALDLLHDIEAHLAHRADTMTMREVGALVGQAFADERRKMNAIIDATLSRVRSGPRSGTMPALQPHVLETPSSPKISSDEPGNVSSRPFTPGSSFGPPSGMQSLGSLSHSAPATSATLGAAQQVLQSRSWISKRVVLMTSSSGALLLGAVLLGAALHGGKAAPQPPAPAVPAVMHDEGDFLDLVVRVSPPSAQISIDGTSVVQNPFHARYPKDGQIHHIIASADGYEPKLEDISFANDVSVDVSLNRREAAPLHQNVASGPPIHAIKHAALPVPSVAALPDSPSVSSSAASRPEIAAGGGHAPLRPIATTNPYGNP